MKKSKLLFLILCVVQLAVPGYLIVEQNQILSQGKVYKFKTQPIDPYDPFRGRYVTLTYNVNADSVPSDKVLQRNDWVYALLEEDEQGFATFSKLITEEPISKEAGSQDYIKLQVGWGSAERGYRVKVPFNRYYASEETAPEIERAVWRREQVENVYAAISILNGKATLKELYVEGLPVREYLKESLKKSLKKKASQTEQ